MGYDQSARTYQRQELIEIVNVALLVCIEEQDIDWLFELRDFLVGVALYERHHLIDTGTFEVLAGQRRSPGVNLMGGQLATCLLKREAEPDAGISVRRTDLNDMLGTDRLCQQAQQPAIFHRNVHHPPALISIHIIEHTENILLCLILRHG